MRTDWCPDGEQVDEAGYCRTCDEMLIGCTDCLRGQCMRCSDEEDDWKPVSNLIPFHDETNKKR